VFWKENWDSNCLSRKRGGIFAGMDVPGSLPARPETRANRRWRTTPLKYAQLLGFVFVIFNIPPKYASAKRLLLLQRGNETPPLCASQVAKSTAQRILAGAWEITAQPLLSRPCKTHPIPTQSGAWSIHPTQNLQGIKITAVKT
jgi:hypothetical protein